MDLFGGLKLFAGAAQTAMGASSAKGGASMQADAARQAAQTEMQIAAYNIGLVNVNLERNIEFLGQKTFRTLSTQVAQTTTTGFSPWSKSFLLLRSDTLDTMESAAKDMRQDAEYERQKIWFEAQAKASAYETQARLYDYQGKQAGRQAMGSIFSSLLG